VIGLGEVRRVELWMTYVRWFGVVFGALAITIEPDHPSTATKQTAWALVLLLGIGNVAIRAAMNRISTDRELARLGAIAFVFDAVIVMSFVWVYAYEDPYVTWALLFVLPLEGALRYRLYGALGAAAAIAVFFIPQSFRVASLNDTGFDITTFVFVTGMSTLVGGVAGTMAENWHRQRVAFLRQSLKLAEVHRLKDRFLAVTSHEIRGPVTAIIAGIDTVLRRGDRLGPEQRRRLLEMVSTQGHQLARLVDDLLLTSELQEHQLALHPDWAELESTIQGAVDAAAPRRRSHHLQMFVEPLRCVIDRARVAQIVRNLVENAYKYTPEHSRVAVSATSVSGGISIEIADDGDGIPANQRDRLFEAFHRGHKGEAGQDGMGLGLYVVSQLVQTMDGRIDLASSSKGTSFTINIPCRTMAVEGRRFNVVSGSERGAAG
jgi:signal transduction histidine kinase